MNRFHLRSTHPINLIYNMQSCDKHLLKLAVVEVSSKMPKPKRKAGIHEFTPCPGYMLFF